MQITLGSCAPFPKIGREDPLHATTRQYEQARAELSTAIALYRTMEMTFWLPETEATLAQVDAR